MKRFYLAVASKKTGKPISAGGGKIHAVEYSSHKSLTRAMGSAKIQKAQERAKEQGYVIKPFSTHPSSYYNKGYRFR